MTGRRKRKRWAPPSLDGVSRWHRLVDAARRCAATPDVGALDLSRACEAVFRDTFPTREPHQQRVLFNWLERCKTFATAPADLRAVWAGGLGVETEGAAAIIGVAPLDAAAAKAGGKAGAPARPATRRYRADVDG